MICLLLIMMMIFVNGTVNAEQKLKHTDTVLREAEMDAKTKAWLLMVESGKVDEEELRRITPKSIFIAPLLTSRTGKCKEGYRHDHLGQCVKVIKLDPKVQLEQLLKRLNTLYAEKKQEEKQEEEEEKLPSMSSGPLHFSLPISEDETSKQPKPEEEATNTTEVHPIPELIPIPLPIMLSNRTQEINETKEIESSGAGPLNTTEAEEISHIDGSGDGSGDSVPEEETTTVSVSLIPEDVDYLDARETESTTETPSTTEIISTTEIESTTTAPNEDVNSTESYQSITDFISGNDSDVDLPNDNTENPELVRSQSQSDIIVFPSEKPRTQDRPAIDTSFIRFPDDPPRPQQIHNYHSSQPLRNWDHQYQPLPSTIPPEQFWWLQENWKVDENHAKSPLVNFWSRLPLIHDISFAEESGHNLKTSFPSTQSPPQVFKTYRQTSEFAPNFNHRSPSVKTRKHFRRYRLFEDGVASPRQAFRIQR